MMHKILSLSLRIIAAIILLQTLYFKFSGAEESVYIFGSLGMEPWGRIGSGVVELIISALLIIPKTKVYGAIGAVLMMAGAILAHLVQLGIEVQGDGGLLFYLAIVVFASAVGLLILHADELKRALTIPKTSTN
ncbi:MAG: DoxX family protein [Bacteroidota bacterium]